MLKINTSGAAALTVVLLSGTAIADDMVYAGFPVTVRIYWKEDDIRRLYGPDCTASCTTR